VLALHHLACERLPILVYQLKGSSNLWSSYTLGSLSYPLALHALFLEFKVPHQQATSTDEQNSGLPRKWLLRICQLFARSSCIAFPLDFSVPYPIAVSALGLLNRLVLRSALGNGLSRLDRRSWEGRPELLGLKSAAREAALTLPCRER
jgi:hypothetical protein